MKAQTPFWSLLKNELAIGCFGGTGQVASVLFVYWLCVGALPLLVVFGDSNSRGNIAALFEAGFLPIIAFLFLSCLAVWIAYATVPAFCDLLSPGGAVPGAVQHLGAFEFLFTRAVDRRKLFRARATVFFVFTLTPLFLNVLVSPFAPEIRFGPADSTSVEAVRRYEQYLKAFPESHPAMVPGQIVIPHGAVAYTAWLAWSGTLAFLLLQGYGALIARRVKPNSWWTAFFPGAPILFLLSSLILAARASRTTHVNFYENSFLFFSAHPLVMLVSLAVLAIVIQTWCERRFSKLEIL